MASHLEAPFNQRAATMMKSRVPKVGVVPQRAKKSAAACPNWLRLPDPAAPSSSRGTSAARPMPSARLANNRSETMTADLRG
jgi:hypothetical protein